MFRTKRNIMNVINITPFVDVMLVLLVIFMAVTPMMSNNIEVNLPTSDVILPETDDKRVNSVVVTLQADQKVFLEDKKIGFKELQFELLKKYSQDVKVLLRGDKNVLYSDVVDIMSELKKSGFHKVSLVVDYNENKEVL